jgi:hypothetical protein
MEQRAVSPVLRYTRAGSSNLFAGEFIMKTLLSAVAALAVITAAGVAMAQDAPTGDTSDTAPAPAKHHHHHHAKKAATEASGDEATAPEAEHHGKMHRTEHGGRESSSSERAETEKLNEQQLAGTGGK